MRRTSSIGRSGAAAAAACARASSAASASARAGDDGARPSPTRSGRPPTAHKRRSRRFPVASHASAPYGRRRIAAPFEHAAPPPSSAPAAPLRAPEYAVHPLADDSLRAAMGRPESAASASWPPHARARTGRHPTSPWRRATASRAAQTPTCAGVRRSASGSRTRTCGGCRSAPPPHAPAAPSSAPEQAGRRSAGDRRRMAACQSASSPPHALPAPPPSPGVRSHPATSRSGPAPPPVLGKRSAPCGGMSISARAAASACSDARCKRTRQYYLCRPLFLIVRPAACAHAGSGADSLHDGHDMPSNACVAARASFFVSACAADAPRRTAAVRRAPPPSRLPPVPSPRACTSVRRLFVSLSPRTRSAQRTRQQRAQDICARRRF